MNEAAALAGQPVRKWSTDVVDPARRLDYWVGAICEAFLEMDCSSRDAQVFGGALTSFSAGELSLNQVRASRQDVYRTAGAIARGRQHPLYLITHLHSPWHVRQAGRLAQLRPGDAVLVDSAQCYELHFPQSVDCLSIQIPRAWAGRWLAQVDGAGPRTAARDQGWGQALSGLCLQLGREPMLAAGYPQVLLSDQLGAMLAAALEPSDASPRRADGALVVRAQAVLREQLGQAGLSGEQVARELGISARSLHRAFAAHGASFAGTLRQYRLAHAAQLLAQPRLQSLGIAELGRRCGFSDASHFVREFQRAHGLTPARWRRQRLQA